MAVYLYMHDVLGYETKEDGEVVWANCVDVLFEIKLPSSLPISDSDNEPPLRTERTIESPVLVIPRHSYPVHMGCVQFDSKVYFIGGIGRGPMGLSYWDPIFSDFSTDGEPDDLTDRVYNRNAYVWDPNDASSGLKELPSMATGKPSAMAFVAQGMIYVIATFVESLAYRLRNESIKHFERFNPVDETWEVLDDSPLKDLNFLTESTVFENHYKVVISGFKNCWSVTRLVYDFKHDKWDSVFDIHEPPRYTICHVSDELRDGGHYLYGLTERDYSEPIKLGPFKDLDHLLKLYGAEISVNETPVSWNAEVDLGVEARHRGIGGRHVSTIHHLGDGYFCHVRGVRECTCFQSDPSPPDCQHSAIVSVFFFKELSSQVQGEQAPLSFEAKLLLIQDNLIQLDLDSPLRYQFGGLLFVAPGNSILDQSMRVRKEECEFMLSSSEDDQRLLSTSMGHELSKRICTKSKVSFGSQGLEKKGLQLLV